MVHIFVILIHVPFCERDQKKYLRILGDKSRIPDGLAEGEAERRRNSFA